MQQKPYVRYKMEADITDKGIGYVIKKAVGAYLAHHKLQGRVNISATSDHFEGILELFPSETMDINMTALLEHIMNSGRLPTSIEISQKILE